MSAGLRGNVGTLRALEAKLRELPRVVGAKVATASADTITTLARSTFTAGENAYGDAWAPGVDGQKVTLVKSGSGSRFSFVAIGTRLRASLGPKYMRYQVGKRPIFPRSGARLPVSYNEALRVTTAATIRAELAGVR